MKLTETQYNRLIRDPNVPEHLVKELADKAREERWSFIGT